MRNAVWIILFQGKLRMLVKLTPEQNERLHKIVLEKKVSATKAYKILKLEEKKSKIIESQTK